MGQEGCHLDTEAGPPVQMPVMAPCFMAGGVLSGAILRVLGSSEDPDRASEDKAGFGGISPSLRRMGSSTQAAIKHMLKGKWHQQIGLS